MYDDRIKPFKMLEFGSSTLGDNRLVNAYMIQFDMTNRAHMSADDYADYEAMPKSDIQALID